MTAARLIHRCCWQDTTEDRMAWTAAIRPDHARPTGSHASDLTDRKRSLTAPLLPGAKPGGRPRVTCHWRMLPRDFPPRSTVYGYYRCWRDDGAWAGVHDALYRSTAPSTDGAVTSRGARKARRPPSSTVSPSRPA